MNDQEKQQIYQQAKSWVLEAGERIRAKMDKPIVIETKSSPNDLVTELDQETERFFIERVRDQYPDHQVLGEEGFGDDIDHVQGTVWIVDPIDGTMNFVHQKQHFAISVGIYQDGVGEIGLIYDVMKDCLYHAKRGEGAYKNDSKLPLLPEDRKLEQSIIGLNHFWSIDNKLVHKEGLQSLIRKARGTRSYGSAALEFAFVAEGIVDAYVTMQLSPWDIAAGVILVQEVGGITTQADGEPITLLDKNSIITCNSAIHQEIIDEHIELKS
ncbi:inositol monophosphatase [Pontibacillus yanchengensis]|uniref:Inositol monophosphatase n=2 Tax=Pontibacillus yanchengensis TaxID=462910 RepID=A0ACC7VBA3_9BACI|nr:inositol monophosphatase family protein [Pontibacillus yanchengensis]MYL32987.1 inositol monophosphatase [Pontibacillus yanchengensis]MYL52163.1 inositol monophosphatase [Pontibacillus yanchengensis]